MTDNIVINKGSKLFQRFLQSKANKQTDTNFREQSEASDMNSSIQGKENSSMIMNKCPNLQSDLRPNEYHEKKECLKEPLVREKKQNNSFAVGSKDTKMVQNSLNISNGLGLDSILKRAIEKVRESKVEGLKVRKNDEEEQHDDSLQKLSKSKIQIKQEQKQEEKEIFCKNDGSQLKESRKKSVSKFIYERSPSQQTLNQEKVEQLTSKNQELQSQIQIYKQKCIKLLHQNQKLLKEVNQQVAENEQLEREVGKLMLQVKQYENIATQKDKQIKKHSDDANHWRNQYELINISMKTIKSSTDMLENKIENLNIEINTLRKEIDMKEDQIIDVKMEMRKLEQQNKIAKQYLYEMTVKLFNSQQELIKIRGVPSTLVESEAKTIQIVEDEPVKPSQPLRKRQFSRERVVSKIEPKTKENQPFHKQTPQVEPQVIPRAQPFQTDTYREARIAQIDHELIQLAQMKCITGKIRRRKIQLQRELQALKN